MSDKTDRLRSDIARLQVKIQDLSFRCHFPNMRSGTSQDDAGAAKGELWADSGDNYTVKLGQ